MALSNLPQREEYLRKKRKLRRIKYGVFIFLIVLIIGGLSFASYRPEVRIDEVVLSGGLLVTEKEVREEALGFMDDSYFWLFPKNSSFLYPRSDLEKYLMERFKRIETIKISLEGLDKMIVEITERKPVAIWCRDIVKKEAPQILPVTVDASTTPTLPALEEKVVSIPSSCYFIDLHSTIFAEAPDFSGDAYFKYYGLVEKENPIGQKYIASSTQFREINNFIEAVKKLSIKPLYLKAKGEDEFSLVLYGGGEVYFDVKKSLSLAYTNLETLLKSPELSSRGGYLPVDYIDLRYGNKLFYKLR
ncbi:MAG: Uncharacterized protein CEO12_351 [Parcubacteria group bacterium Gr01-1014_46]|nr:MAG: Uncharacterized protein CEO12_351 [Parcubacteria group bacterium Gr01-1014_46]